MSRIPIPATEQAPSAAQPLLASAKKQLGTVPNLLRILANSPAALEAYLGFSGALAKGALDAATRERVALAVAEVNGCDYCLSAHTYLARKVAKLDDAEITANRSGASNDIKADAAFRFAAKLARERGRVSEADVAAVKHAGYSDAEVVEIIAHVALSLFTNTVNVALKTDIDFPRIGRPQDRLIRSTNRRRLAPQPRRSCYVRSFQHRRCRRPQSVLSRGRQPGSPDRSAAAWLSEREPHVPRPDSAACDRYHVVAPDLPGFGMTEQPARDKFAYTFENIAKVIGRFTEVLRLEKFAIYVFDYGAPVGFRLAVKNPERITAIVTQNGNTYLEGVSEAFAPVQAYWKEPTQTNRDALQGFLSPQTTLFQYTHGVADPSLVSPDGRNLDDFYLARPGNDEIQLDLLLDYQSNVALYGTIQTYLREHRPPVLAVWGKNDPFFIPAGAEAFKRDVPSADIRFVDGGHFALETHALEIGAAMREFLGKHIG